MDRDIYKKLRAWKASSRRKPLLLQGARQTGKTFILKEFGLREYRNTAYCNFEEDPSLGRFFQRDLNPKRILAELSIYRLSHIKFHRVIGRRRITIQPPPSGLVKFNM